jgi:hypothetical protein
MNVKDNVANIDINFQLVCAPNIDGGRLSLEIVCEGNDTMVCYLKEHSLENWQEILCVKNHLNEMMDIMSQHSADCELEHADVHIFQSVKMSL